MRSLALSFLILVAALPGSAQRLPGGAIPEHYELWFAPDFRTDTFAGRAKIRITYKGVLNDKLRGFYLSEANGRKYGVSQMEATDARRAFPCFDEPAYKAAFAIS